VKNPTYWGAGKVIVEKVTGLVINDVNQALTRYRAGELDHLEPLPPGQYPRLKKELPLLRLRNFGDRMLRRLAPPLAAYRSRSRFRSMLEVSNLGEYEHSYSLPTSVFEEDSREW